MEKGKLAVAPSAPGAGRVSSPISRPLQIASRSILPVRERDYCGNGSGSSNFLDIPATRRDDAQDQVAPGGGSSMAPAYNPIVRTFCRFRAVLVGSLGIDRRLVHPRTPLDDLIPVERRGEALRRLREAG